MIPLAHLAAHTADRVQAVLPLLDALFGIGDAQVGLRLLRTCAGYGCIVHSLRCNPPHAQLQPLQTYNTALHSAFSSITGLHLNATQREQAGRGLAYAGRGLRSAALDAPAAYLASVGSTATACAELDGGYVAASVVVDPAVTVATTMLNAMLTNPLAPGAALSMTQKALARATDEASWRTHLEQSAAQALLRSEAEPGARVGPHGWRVQCSSRSCATTV